MRFSAMFRKALAWVLLLGVWALSGCNTMGEVKDVAAPPSGFNPKIRGVCHTQGTVVVTELPDSFIRNKTKVVLLVKLQAVSARLDDNVKKPNWAAFDPSISVNGKSRIYFKPDMYQAIQIKSVEINTSDLKPGMNTINISAGFISGQFDCHGPCCGIGVGLAFEDDPRIPFI